MSELSQYILSIAVAAVISAIIGKMLPANGAAAKIGKTLCGFFLLFTVLHPVADFQLAQWEDIRSSIEYDAAQAAEAGKSMAQNEWKSIISERVSAYILDKAEKFDASLTVTVQLSEDQIPMPVQVQISGNISPYGKQQLQTIIEENLGIPKEAQIWT